MQPQMDCNIIQVQVPVFTSTDFSVIESKFLNESPLAHSWVPPFKTAANNCSPCSSLREIVWELKGKSNHDLK